MKATFPKGSVVRFRQCGKQYCRCAGVSVAGVGEVTEYNRRHGYTLVDFPDAASWMNREVKFTKGQELLHLELVLSPDTEEEDLYAEAQP